MHKPLKFSKDELKRTLLGVVETAVFIKHGPSRFPNTQLSAMQSFFVIPVVLAFNLYILFLIWNTNPDIAQTPYIQIASRYIYNNLYCLIFVLLMVFAFCKAQNRMEYFPRFVCGFNWLSIAPISIILIPILLVSLGFHNMKEIEDFSFVITLYELSLTGFFFTYALKINWFSAAFLTLAIFLIQNLALIATFNP